jgi:antitoxin (DNA-binding transcriptional repressor) of toxin-antitoxin stability system
MPCYVPAFFETKTKLSELVKKVQNGETVIITSGREKTPVAKIVAVKKKRLGAMLDPDFVMGEVFWEPLPKGWDGESE